MASLLWSFTSLPVKSMSLLQKQSMFKGFPSSINETPSCESCIVGKHQGDSLPWASYRAKDCLELVHTDLCGPMQNQSIGGSFYFLKFIDDFSRKVWVYFLKHKSDTSHISKSSRLKQRNKVANLSKFWDQMEEENMILESLLIFVNNMV